MSSIDTIVTHSHTLAGHQGYRAEVRSSHTTDPIVFSAIEFATHFQVSSKFKWCAESAHFSRKMPHLILRKYKSSEKIELTVPDLKELSIGELKENASSKLGIPQDELSK